LQGICKHGVNRSELIVADEDLPFNHIKKQIEQRSENGEAQDGEADGSTQETEFLWPRDLVIARRIESLCELVLKPKPLSKRGALNRKRKAGQSDAKDNGVSKPSGLKLTLKVNKKQDYASEDESMATYSSDDGDDTDDMLEQASERIHNRSHNVQPVSEPDTNEAIPSKRPRLEEA
jgi:hypothetical protein